MHYLLLLIACSLAAQTNPYTSAQDLEAGRKLYLGRCAHCHGQDGEGGRGVSLNTGRFRHGSSDREIFLTIRNGIPNTEMPPAFRLPEHEIWRMAAHVKQLARQASPEDPVTGDAALGEQLYRKHACAQCHTLNGQGGFLGPDLTGIVPNRALRHLRESIANPNADIPLEYRTVSVVADRTITGLHLNEDEYSVHLREASGAIRSFLKRDLKEIRYSRQSLMPAYALSKADLDNLIAYMNSAGSSLWRFDRLTNIGGHPTTVLGDPKLIDSPIGKAVLFDGIDDALFIENHPLAGAAAFTFEAIFRPDGGPFEQRWFHLSEQGTDNRMLFEIRVTGGKWYLDSFNQSGSQSKALMNRNALHPLGQWHHVASVYDGVEFRNYVDGLLEGSANITFAPHGPGRSSVGVRINKVFYFTGAVHSARFTPRALPPAQFLRVAIP
jgi:putative heme-binding domain-containing protein